MIASVLGTMTGSFVLSAIVSLWSQAREDKHEQRLAEIASLNALDSSHDAASRRGGQWMRRVIGCSAMFYLFVVPAILYGIDPDTFTTAYGHIKEGGGVMSLLSGKNPKLVVSTFKGLPMMPEHLHTLVACVGFYFGGDATKR